MGLKSYRCDSCDKVYENGQKGYMPATVLPDKNGIYIEKVLCRPCYVDWKTKSEKKDKSAETTPTSKETPNASIV